MFTCSPRASGNANQAMRIRQCESGNANQAMPIRQCQSGNANQVMPIRLCESGNANQAMRIRQCESGNANQPLDRFPGRLHLPSLLRGVPANTMRRKGYWACIFNAIHIVWRSKSNQVSVACKHTMRRKLLYSGFHIPKAVAYHDL